MTFLVSLSAEGAAFGNTDFSSSGLAKNVSASTTDNNGLGVAEDSGDVHATWALDIHEVRVGALYETLELVRVLFVLNGGVQEIDGQLLMV